MTAVASPTLVTGICALCVSIASFTLGLLSYRRNLRSFEAEYRARISVTDESEQPNLASSRRHPVAFSCARKLTNSGPKLVSVESIALWLVPGIYENQAFQVTAAPADKHVPPGSSLMLRVQLDWHLVDELGRYTDSDDFTCLCVIAFERADGKREQLQEVVGTVRRLAEDEWISDRQSTPLTPQRILDQWRDIRKSFTNLS